MQLVQKRITYGNENPIYDRAFQVEIPADLVETGPRTIESRGKSLRIMYLAYHPEDRKYHAHPGSSCES